MIVISQWLASEGGLMRHCVSSLVMPRRLAPSEMLSWKCAVCALLLQKRSDSMSSSEVSTVDLRPLKERRESLDFELELPVDDPDACFPQGERITAGVNYGIIPKVICSPFILLWTPIHYYIHAIIQSCDSSAIHKFTQIQVKSFSVFREKSDTIVGIVLPILDTWRWIKHHLVFFQALTAQFWWACSHYSLRSCWSWLTWVEHDLV